MAISPLGVSLSKCATTHPEQHARGAAAWARTFVSAAPKLLLVGAGYYVGTRIGFALTPAQDPIATFWPPNAILLGAFLLTPLRMWWTLILAVLPAHVFAQFQAGVPVSTALGWFIGNVSEALIGAWCIHRFARRKDLFESVHGVIVFLIFGMLIAPLATSFLDVAAVVATGWGAGFWKLWTARLFSNMLATVTIVPAMVVLGSKGAFRIRDSSLTRYAEAGFLALAIMLVSGLVFGAETPSWYATPALVYAPLPLLLWASVRFGTGGLGLSLIGVVLVSVWNTMNGRGPFASPSMAVNILSLQVLLCIVAVPLLLLTAVMVERLKVEESLRATSGKLIDAQEEERRRIARELHDDIGQQLALAELEIGRLREELPPFLQHARLTYLASQLAAVSKATSEMSHRLHPSAIGHIGIAPAVKGLCREFSREQVCNVQFVVDEVPDFVPPHVSLCLYRVAQESLHNIAKHSQARNASVELKTDRDGLLLRVTDDGVGFSPERRLHAGLGLVSMQERLRSVGGTITIVSAPAKGTRIELWVPLQRALSAAAGAKSSV